MPNDEQRRGAEQNRSLPPRGKGGTFLYLRDLGLTQLPPEIVQLTALAELSLIENQFTRLPLALLNLTHLKALFQHGNPGLKLSLTFLGE